MCEKFPEKTLDFFDVFIIGIRAGFQSIPKLFPLIIILLIWTAIPFLLFYRNLWNPLEAHWTIGFAFLAYYLGLVTLLITVYYKLIDMLSGTSESLGSVFQKSLRMLPYFLLSMICSLILIAVGLAAFVLPGLYAAFVIALFYPFIVWENIRNPIYGLKRFFELVWGHWWKTFAIFILPGLIFGFLFALVQFLTAIFIGNNWVAQHVHIIQHTLDIILKAIYIPFNGAIFLVYLNDLKLRHEQKIAEKEALKNVTQSN